MLAPPELRAIHPLGKSPVVTENDEALAETGAIVEYVLERYGAGRLAPPDGTRERRRLRYWLHYAEGSAMPPLLLKLVFERIPAGAPAARVPAGTPFGSRRRLRGCRPVCKNGHARRRCSDSEP